MTMANEALDAAIGKINFGSYDNDGNGYVGPSRSYPIYFSFLISPQVDAYVVVHAGRAAEETGNRSDIWSVKWTLPQEREVNGICSILNSRSLPSDLSFNLGVKIYGFLTVPEDAKCGVCAHEVGHLGKSI